MQNPTIRIYLILSNIIILSILLGCNSLSKKESSYFNSVPANLNKAEIIKTNDSIDFPIMKFEKTVINLDTIHKGEIAKIEYNFKNTGTAPLLIEEIIPSCGCTKPNYSISPILPGEQSRITLEFDSKNKEGFQDLNLVVVTNTYKKYYLLRFIVYVNGQ